MSKKNKKDTEVKTNKAIVKPIGSCMYIDITNGDHIPENKPSVVFYTDFVSEKVGDGKIRLITPNLPEEANNHDFQNFLKESEGDEELAVAAYVATFGLDETGNKLAGKNK